MKINIYCLIVSLAAVLSACAEGGGGVTSVGSISDLDECSAISMGAVRLVSDEGRYYRCGEDGWEEYDYGAQSQSIVRKDENSAIGGGQPSSISGTVCSMSTDYRSYAKATLSKVNDPMTNVYVEGCTVHLDLTLKGDVVTEKITFKGCPSDYIAEQCELNMDKFGLNGGIYGNASGSCMGNIMTAVIPFEELCTEVRCASFEDYMKSEMAYCNYMNS